MFLRIDFFSGKYNRRKLRQKLLRIYVTVIIVTDVRSKMEKEVIKIRGTREGHDDDSKQSVYIR